MVPLGSGQTVHVKVVDVACDRGEPVIDFVVLDEGPLLGEHLEGRPAGELAAWMGAILDHQRATRVPMERMLHHSCRAVIGIKGRLWQRCVVEDVLPA